MAFYETQFPTDISVGAVGGPSWKTDVVVFDSGGEQRNQRWSELRGEFDVSYGVRTIDQLHNMVSFFNEMRGRQHAFRYKDFLDYSVTEEPITVDGSPTSQLTKVYGSGFNDYTKDIKKPVNQGLFRNNGLPLATPSVDTTTGVVTFAVERTSIIAAVTRANPGVISSGSHGLVTGDEVYLHSSFGMTEINELVVVATVIDTNSFSIGIDTTLFSEFTGSATVEKYPQSTDIVDWTGEYDTPCRFNVDSMSVRLDTYEIGGTQVPIIEVKL